MSKAQHVVLVQRYRKGRRSTWVTAYGLAKGWTTCAAFAQDVREDYTTITRIRKAQVTRLALLPYRNLIPHDPANPCSFPMLRRDLSIWHWATIGELSRTYDLSPAEQLYYLYESWLYQSGHSAMRRAIDGQESKRPKEYRALMRALSYYADLHPVYSHEAEMTRIAMVLLKAGG